MDEFGQSILDGQAENDVAALISLQHLAETIVIFHRSKDVPMNDPIAAEVNSQMFQNGFLTVRNSIAEETRNQRKPLCFTHTMSDKISPAHIALLERFIGIHIYSHELGFLKRPYREFYKTVESTASLAHLSACLEACKRYFEYLLQIPEAHYADFTALQWSPMVQSILILSRLTFVMASRCGWDAESTRTNIPLGMYLDALCFRFQSTSATPAVNGTPARNPDMLYVFYLILSSMKRSYARRIAKIEPKTFNPEYSTGTGLARGHCPILDPTLSQYFDLDEYSLSNWDMAGGSIDPSPQDTSVSSSSATLPTGMLYHDLWATMTGSWANESGCNDTSDS